MDDFDAAGAKFSGPGGGQHFVHRQHPAEKRSRGAGAEAGARTEHDERVLADIGQAEVGAELAEFRKGLPEAVGRVAGSGLEGGENNYRVGILRRFIEIGSRRGVADDVELATAGGDIGAEADQRKLVQQIEQQVGRGLVGGPEIERERGDAALPGAQM